MTQSTPRTRPTERPPSGYAQDCAENALAGLVAAGLVADDLVTRDRVFNELTQHFYTPATYCFERGDHDMRVLDETTPRIDLVDLRNSLETAFSGVLDDYRLS